MKNIMGFHLVFNFTLPLFTTIAFINAIVLNKQYLLIVFYIYKYIYNNYYINFFILGPHLWHMEVPRLGVKLDL